jgi:hypothetical protein
MKKEDLRLIEYNKSIAPFREDSKIKTGLFHKWIGSEKENVTALIEDYETGVILYRKAVEIRFLTKEESKEFYDRMRAKEMDEFLKTYDPKDPNNL